MNSDQLEKYSSAITLSDMEIFVFPELMYSLVLANIMSPVLWQWRQLDCFKKLEDKNSYKKLMRLKQFIMDEFEFNLNGVFNPSSLTRIYELTEFAKTLSWPGKKNPDEQIGVIEVDILASSSVDHIGQGGPGEVRFEWLMSKPPSNIISPVFR